MKETPVKKILTPQELAALLGQPLYEVWTAFCARFDEKYEMECLQGSGYRDWVYEQKYRRGGKTLCTLCAQENRIGLQIVFGKAEREKVEAIREELSPATLRTYDAAHTWHDGKWVMFHLEEPSQFDEFFRLLSLKRRPNRK